MSEPSAEPATPSPDPPHGPLRRVAAVVALMAGGVALVLALRAIVREPLGTFVAVVATLVALAAGWVALTNRGVRRVLAGLVAVAAVVGALVALDLADRHALVGLGVVVGVLVSSVATRFALGLDRPTLEAQPTPGLAVPPADRPVLFVNPRSGDGKAGRAGLVDEARRRRIRVAVLQEGDDVVALAERAVDEGADVIGMAGGDGSQALVAACAARRGVAHVCVPSGTRNHFALDLGLDRSDVVGALAAFDQAVERRIDLASVNGRVFVNTVSLGVYAEIVQRDEYREDKVGTTVRLLPQLVGPGEDPLDLRFDDANGTEHATAQVIQVSNNPYQLTGGGFGSRPRLDGGVLGIIAVQVDDPIAASGLAALPVLGVGERQRGLMQWSSPAFEVRSSVPVAAGVDGEALVLDPPLRFTSEPGVLRVRLPPRAPGYSPAAASPGAWWVTNELLRRALLPRRTWSWPTPTP